MIPTKAAEDVLVEQVAKAIWHAQWEEAWPRKGGIEHAHALETARAAIEASGITTLLERERRKDAALDEAEAYLAAGAGWSNAELENPIMARACGMGCRDGLEKLKVRRAALTREGE